MPYGDTQKSLLSENILGSYKRKVPDLRDVAPNGKCVTYMMINGVKTPVKIQEDKESQ